MRKAVTSIIICLACTLFAADELLTAAGHQFDSLFASNFSVNMTSAEINRIISAIVSKKTAEMGFPMQINAKCFKLTSNKNVFSCKVILNVDENMRSTLEPNANEMMTTFGVSQTLANMTLGVLYKTSAFIKNNGDSFKKATENDMAVQYSFEGTDSMSLGDLSVTKGLINVNKTTKQIMAVRFDLSDGSAIIAQFDFTDNNGKCCPNNMVIQHSLKTAVAGFRLPSPVRAAFSDYSFK